mmetsp:Transcript_5577/g.21532  ORF Transcript_5577/g.21532 Transcript_5577/m.21532 type:complete len:335 (-) Transcript_5577:386-1390(-)
MALGRGQQPAILLDARDELVHGGQPGGVARLDGVGIGQHRKRLGRRDEAGPVGVVQQPAAVGIVGHEDVDATGLQLALARLGRAHDDHGGLLERRRHHRFHEGAGLHRDTHAGLVDVFPALHDAAALGRDAVDVALQIGPAEAQCLLALRRHADREHRHVAAVLQQVVDQGREGRIDIAWRDLEVGREGRGQVDVDAGQLAGARIAQRDAVVVGPDADAQLAAVAHTLAGAWRSHGRGRRGRQRQRQRNSSEALHAQASAGARSRSENPGGGACNAVSGVPSAPKPGLVRLTHSRSSISSGAWATKASTMAGSKPRPDWSTSIASARSSANAGR